MHEDDHRSECESLSNEDNPDRRASEVEVEHDGGDDQGDNGGGGSSGSGGSSGPETHDELTCTRPKLTP